MTMHRRRQTRARTQTYTHISPCSGGVTHFRSAGRSQRPLLPQAQEGRSDKLSPPPSHRSPVLPHSPPAQSQDSWSPPHRPMVIGERERRSLADHRALEGTHSASPLRRGDSRTTRAGRAVFILHGMCGAVELRQLRKNNSSTVPHCLEIWRDGAGQLGHRH